MLRTVCSACGALPHEWCSTTDGGQVAARLHASRAHEASGLGLLPIGGATRRIPDPVDQVPAEWHRDAQPLRRCACGHYDYTHEITKSSRDGRCRTGPCPCRTLTPVELHWTERRRVVEHVCCARPDTGHTPDCRRSLR